MRIRAHHSFARKAAVAGAVALLAAPSGIAAKTTMRIDADVPRGCSLAALPMMFGNVSITLPSATAQAPIFLDCTPNTAFTVAMDNGLNFNAGQRRMARTGPGLGSHLDYEVYRDSARSLRWGAAAGQVVSGVAPADGKVTLLAYGRTSGLVAAGVFQDTITVTATF